MGLLARAYLFRAGYSLHQDGKMKRPDNYKEYYKRAKEVCSELITSHHHSLNPSYERVFRNVCEYKLEPKEVMYEVQFYNPTGGTEHTGTELSLSRSLSFSLSFPLAPFFFLGLNFS